MDCAILLPLLADAETASALMALLRELLTPEQAQSVIMKGLSCVG